MTTTTTELFVKEIINSKNAVSMEQGNLIYKKIKYIWDDNPNQKIIVDFKDIQLTATSFFNASISYLFKDFPSDFIKDNLEVVNLDKPAKHNLNISVNNAIKKYQKNTQVENQTSSNAQVAKSRLKDLLANEEQMPDIQLKESKDTIHSQNTVNISNSNAPPLLLTKDKNLNIIDSNMADITNNKITTNALLNMENVRLTLNNQAIDSPYSGVIINKVNLTNDNKIHDEIKDEPPLINNVNEQQDSETITITRYGGWII